jgi:hypothetical protein
MPVVLKDLLDAGYAVSEEDITNAEFKHSCPHCKRTFSTRHGLSVHIGRWCGEAEREEFAQSFEVASITDARGPPNNRFYKVNWLGANATNWYLRQWNCAWTALASDVGARAIPARRCLCCGGLLAAFAVQSHGYHRV